MFPEYAQMPSVVKTSPKIRNGLVWYAAILPALGLFLENYALNKYLGILIWAVVILARPAACLADRRILVRSGAVDASPAAMCFIPTVYLFKRCFDLKQNTAVAVVCLIAFSYGVIGNGFVVGMSMDDDKAVELVKQRYAASIAGVSGVRNPESFDEALGKAAENIDYSVSKEGDRRTVTVNCTDRSSSDKYAFIFYVVHDGFTLKELKLEEFWVNGDKLEGKDRTKLLRKVLLPDLNFTDDESSE